MGPSPKCLPTSVPVLPILLTAILYFLQYIQSFPPILCLFYLMQFYIPYLFVSNNQLGLPIYLWYPILHQHMTKFNIVNLECIISATKYLRLRAQVKPLNSCSSFASSKHVNHLVFPSFPILLPLSHNREPWMQLLPNNWQLPSKC